MNKTNFIRNILKQTIINVFYKQIGLLLGLVYLIMFGAVRGDQLMQYHLKLIEGSFQSYPALFLVMGIWLLYVMLTGYILTKLLTSKQYFFIKQLRALPINKQYIYIGFVIIICLLPISSYACIMALVGCGKGYMVKALLIFLFQVISHCLLIVLFRQKLKTESIQKAYNTQLIKIQHKYLWQFHISFVLKKQLLLWFTCKLICFLLIKASFFTGNPNEELRFSIFFYILGLSIHLPLIQQLLQWEYHSLWIQRVLPISVFKKTINYFITTLLIVLPEIVLLATAFPQHMNSGTILMLMLITTCSVYYYITITISSGNDKQNTSSFLFLYLLLSYGMVLQNTLILFAIILLSICIIVLCKSIHNMEPDC